MAEYPALTEAVRQNAFGAAEEWIDDADFTFGLGPAPRRHRNAHRRQVPLGARPFPLHIT